MENNKSININDLPVFGDVSKVYRIEEQDTDSVSETLLFRGAIYNTVRKNYDFFSYVNKLSPDFPKFAKLCEAGDWEKVGAMIGISGEKDMYWLETEQYIPESLTRGKPVRIFN